MRRQAFDPETPLPPHGSPDIPAQRGPRMCNAPGCRFPGSLTDQPGASVGWCAHHHGVQLRQLSVVSDVLGQHSGLVDLVLEGRRANRWAPPESLSAILGNQQRRLVTLGYTEPLREGGRRYAGVTDFSAWVNAVDRMLGDLVSAVKPKAKQQRLPAIPKASESVVPAIDRMPLDF